MTAAAIAAGRAFVEVFLKDSALRTGLRGLEQRLKTAGRAVGAAAGMAGAGMMAGATAVLAPMGKAVADFAAAGDELTKLSDRTGVSVESLSELSHAAKRSDVDVSSFRNGLKGFARVFDDARDGSATAVQTFDKLGLSIENLAAQSPEQRFLAVADAIARVQDPSLRAALAMEAFGKSGEEMLPMVKGGAAGIEALRQKARELGLQVSTADASAATELGDRWGDVTDQLDRAKFSIGAALAPTLTELLQTVSKYLTIGARWIDDNRDLVVTVAKVAAIVGAAGAGLVLFGGFCYFATFAVSGLSVAIGLLGSIAAFAVSPLGLVAAGAAAAAVGLYKLNQSGKLDTFKQALSDSYLGDVGRELRSLGSYIGGELTGLFRNLGNIAVNAFQGIKDAMAAGDMQLAGEVAMKGLEAAWAAGTATLTTIWEDFKLAMVETFAGAMIAIRRLWIDTQGAISKGILDMAMQEGVVGDLFSAMTGTDLRKRQKETQAKQDATDPNFRAGLADAVARKEQVLAALAPAENLNMELLRREARNLEGRDRHRARYEEVTAQIATGEAALAKARELAASLNTGELVGDNIRDIAFQLRQSIAQQRKEAGMTAGTLDYGADAKAIVDDSTKSAIAAMEDFYAKMTKEQREGRNSRVEEAQAELKAAIDALKESTDAAAKARAEKEAKDKEARDAAQAEADQLAQAQADATKAGEQVTAGTFSGWRLQQQMGTTQEKLLQDQLAEQKQQNVFLGNIKDEIGRRQRYGA